MIKFDAPQMSHWKRFIMKINGLVVSVLGIATFALSYWQLAAVTEDAKINITDRVISAQQVTLMASLINGGSTSVQLTDLQLRVVKGVKKNLWDTEEHECQQLAGDRGQYQTHLPDEPNWEQAEPYSFASHKLVYTFDPPISTAQSVAFCFFIEATDINGKAHTIIRDGFRVIYDKSNTSPEIKPHNVEPSPPLIFEVIERSRTLSFL